jgi:nucleoside-diphosphate-sugar epimerase
VRALILGATGFLGSPIRRAVEEHPRVDDVVAVGVTPPVDGRPWRELDLAAADDAALADLLAEYKPDAVINAAGRTTGTPEQLHDLNVAMVDRLLGAVHRVVPGARVVHVGSAAEYGPPRAGEPTRETDETHPVGPYGETKLASTQAMVAAAAAGLDTVVLRVFNPIGAGMDPRTMPGNAARQMADALVAGEGEVRLGSLAAYRDFVDADDVADAVAAAVHPAAARGHVVNVGSGRATQARDIVRALATAAGYDGPIHEDDGGSARSAAVSWQQADVAKAADLLAWSAGTTLAESVAKLWATTPGAPVGATGGPAAGR